MNKIILLTTIFILINSQMFAEESYEEISDDKFQDLMWGKIIGNENNFFRNPPNKIKGIKSFINFQFLLKNNGLGLSSGNDSRKYPDIKSDFIVDVFSVEQLNGDNKYFCYKNTDGKYDKIDMWLIPASSKIMPIYVYALNNKLIYLGHNKVELRSVNINKQ